MSKILEFLRINLEFLEIASVALLPRNDAGNSRIPPLQKSIKDRTANFIKFTKDDCAISFGYLLGTKAFGTEQTNCQSQKLKAFESKLKEEINTYKIP